MEIRKGENGQLILIPENEEESQEIEDICYQMRLGDRLYLQAIGSQKTGDVTFPIIEVKNSADSFSCLISSANPFFLEGLTELENNCGFCWHFVWPEEQPDGSWAMIIAQA